MNDISIDNTIDSDLKRVVTWQYDNASNLVSVIGMFRDFFQQSTSDLWNGILSGIDITTEDEDSDFDLAKWGKLLGVERPMLTINGEQVTMNSEAYRKILVARFRLLNSSATTEDYIDFIKYIFGNDVAISYNDNMALSFSYTGDVPQGTNSVPYHLYAAFNQCPEILFLYPAGVRSNVQSNDPIVAFEEQATGTIYTSIVVRVYGTSGTAIPSGAKFVYDSSTYTTAEAATIGDVGYSDIRFKCAGTLYIPACTGVTVTDSSGNDISGVTESFCFFRSVTDFTPEHLDNATIAWHR